MMDRDALKNEFILQLKENVVEMKRYGRFNKLEQFLNNNGYYEGAIHLANSTNTTGFIKLFENNRLDLTIESLIVKERYESLFDKELIKRCKSKLV